MMNQAKKVQFLTIFIILSILLTGCWDSREVEQLAIITTMGIDKINGEWHISARCLNPASMASQKGGGAPSGASSDVLLKGTGQTPGDAIIDFAKRIPRIVFFGELENVIIGEEAAKENIRELVEVHLRYRDARPRTNLLITKGTAYEILQTGPELANNLSKEIDKLAELNTHRFGTSCGANYVEFARSLLSPDSDPIAPIINVLEVEETKYPDIKGPTKSIFLEGLAVFRGENLAGWLDSNETLGFLLAKKKIKNGEISFPIDHTQGEHFSYLIGRTSNKIIPHVQGDKISYTLEIKTMGAVVDSADLLLNLENIREVEQRISDELLEIVLQTIRKSKEYNSDFLGFSQALHRHEPDTWKKIKSRWRDSFQESNIEVIVEAQVNSTGRHGERFKLPKEQ